MAELQGNAPVAKSDAKAVTSAPQRREHVLFDLLSFIKQNKKWWLLPIIIVFLLLSIIVVLAATEAAPFIYTLF
jgi:hypothetical protein